MLDATFTGKVKTAAYDVGLRVGVWHPGDGVTRYRFFRETAEANAKNNGYYDYFSGSNALATVLGRKAALEFIEAYRLGRCAGIREACVQAIHALDADQSVDQVQDRIENLINRGPWHFG